MISFDVLDRTYTSYYVDDGRMPGAVVTLAARWNHWADAIFHRSRMTTRIPSNSNNVLEPCLNSDSGTFYLKERLGFFRSLWSTVVELGRLNRTDLAFGGVVFQVSSL